MTYPCERCILDFIASSGPQTRQDLRRECRAQAVPYDNLIFAVAMHRLLELGEIVFDSPDDEDPYYDFPDSYYERQL